MGPKPRGPDPRRTPRLARTALVVGGVLVLLWANVSLLTSGHDGALEHADRELPGGGGRRSVLDGGWASGGVRQRRRRHSTLVVYVYNAVDEEQQRNFAFFLRYGITEDAATYRIVITKGPGVVDFPRLPSLPPNAAYLRTGLCTNTWGTIDAVMRALPIATHSFFVVVDSSVRGPFLPPYIAAGDPDALHWTEAFTNKLGAAVRLVGSVISCEGAPRGGDAAADWRANPHVMPYAWATDSAGWELLAAAPGVFRCHADPWDARYYSDVGASLAVLRAGYTLDCLMARYQGVDWTSTASWRCNQRVRPDLELHYDGISLTPYETLFVPVAEGPASHRWSFVEAAARYEEWMDSQLRPPEKRPGVHTNAWISDHWVAKAERLVYMNTRGPGCFDFAFYREHNPDLESMPAGSLLALWEHFTLLGQFQGRRHRFSCPMQVGNSYRVAYVLARGARCFDHDHYSRLHPDLHRAGLVTPAALLNHFAEFGQFERRKVRFSCADTMAGLPAGFDGGQHRDGGGRGGARGRSKPAHSKAEEEAVAADVGRRAADGRAEMAATRGDADDAVQQALKGALVEEAAKDAFKGW